MADAALAHLQAQQSYELAVESAHVLPWGLVKLSIDEVMELVEAAKAAFEKAAALASGFWVGGKIEGLVRI